MIRKLFSNWNGFDIKAERDKELFFIQGFLDSMRDEPDMWEYDDYYLFHKNREKDYRFWIANGKTSLAIHDSEANKGGYQLNSLDILSKFQREALWEVILPILETKQRFENAEFQRQAISSNGETFTAREALEIIERKERQAERCAEREASAEAEKNEEGEEMVSFQISKSTARELKQLVEALDD